MSTSHVKVSEGSGKNLATHAITEDAITKELSRVTPTSSDGTELGTASNPVRTNPTGTTTQPVSVTALPLPSGAATETTVAASNTNAGSTSDSAVVSDADGTLSAKLRGLVKILADVWDSVNHRLKVDGSGVTQPVSAASLPLPSGAATEATLDARLGALTETAPATDTASSGVNGRLQRIAQRLTSLIALIPSALTGSGNFKIAVVEDTTSNKSVNVAQANGVTLLMGAGNTGTGSIRVTIVSDQAAIPASQSGTWTVQPGNTANSTPWLVTPTPGTSGGWSVDSETALTNTKVAVKASAGTFGGYMFYNPNATVAYIQVWNVASASVTVGGTAPTYVIPLPATSAANVEFGNGINHSTAITVAATTTPTGSTAPSTALTGFFLYK